MGAVMGGGGGEFHVEPGGGWDEGLLARYRASWSDPHCEVPHEAMGLALGRGVDLLRRWLAAEVDDGGVLELIEATRGYLEEFGDWGEVEG